MVCLWPFLFALYSEERAVVTTFPLEEVPGGTDPALLRLHPPAGTGDGSRRPVPCCREQRDAQQLVPAGPYFALPLPYPVPGGRS